MTEEQQVPATPIQDDQMSMADVDGQPLANVPQSAGHENGHVDEAHLSEPVPPLSGQEPVSLHATLEALLFVAGDAVAVSHFAKVLQLSESEVVAGLEALGDEYKSNNRGLRLQVHRNRYQLVTAPSLAQLIEDFLNLDLSSKLSGPALETLAIVAYRQPVARAQIEAVRGVDCAGVLRSLAQRELIEEVGRLETVGRPILYGVTDLFLQHFGLTGMDELPPLEALDGDALLAATVMLDDDGADADSDH